MNLSCPHCKHEWSDDLEDDQAYLYCPQCAGKAGVEEASSISIRAPEPKKADPAQTQTAPPETQKARPTVPPTPTPAETSQTAVPEPNLDFEDPEDIPTLVNPEGTPPPVAPAPMPPADDHDETPTQISDPNKPTPTPTPVSGRAPKKKTKQSGQQMDHLIGTTIDGYRIESKLGEGGMGAVFLAHQISLDRKVAIKVLPTRFADSAEFVARFTREALSAAQLNHHNIVQVYDVGVKDGLNYIAMEFVTGESLGNMIRTEKRLQVDDAASYALQTARGLKYAHERGIIHRDIKPDNLMLNEQGIVKIADMGLAKMIGVEEKAAPKIGEQEAAMLRLQSADMTDASIAMGSPSYMAPEQGTDARSVDGRADQYSLGCALYYLTAGQAPYSGTTAFELLSKHKNEPLTPIERHVRGVPPAFKVIIERMLEKSPDDRYPDMGGVIKDIEGYLDIDSEKGPYTPRERHVEVLEDAQKEYYAAPSIKKRRAAIGGFFAAMGLLLLGTIFSKAFVLAGGVIGLAVLTPLTGFIIDGLRTHNYLFRRTRAVFFNMPWRSWVQTIFGVVVGLGALWVLGWLWIWIAFTVLAAGLAFGYQFGVARPLRAERSGPIESTRQMLKQLRIKGVAEEGIREFCGRFSGTNWEEFFEELFGYEAMILAREQMTRADQVKRRKRFAIWREPLARWLDGVEEGRKRKHERRLIARAEARRLKAQGVAEAEAKKRAEKEASKVVEVGLTRKPPKPKKAEEVVVVGERGKGLRLILGGARALVGAAFIGGFAARFALSADAGEASGFLAEFFSDAMYYGWGSGGNPIAALAGALVIASAFSRRSILAWLTVVGSGLLVFTNPIVEAAARDQFTAPIAFLGAVALILLGIGPSIMSKVGGGKF